MFDRWAIVEAYALYDMLWNPTPYAARLHRIGYFNPNLSLENASAEVKAIYGALVRRHETLYTAYERYHRRNPASPAWPGTQWMQTHFRVYNRDGAIRAWFASIGVSNVIDCYA